MNLWVFRTRHKVFCSSGLKNNSSNCRCNRLYIALGFLSSFCVVPPGQQGNQEMSCTGQHLQHHRKGTLLIPQSEMLQFYFTLLVNFHPCKSRDVVIE